MSFSQADLDCFSVVHERDIDVALVLALRSSDRVRSLFAEIGRCTTRLISVRSSVGSGDGREIDIELVLGAARRGVRFEIENKLASPFQREQCADYGRRAARARERDGVGTGFSVLVAPAEYLKSSSMSAAHFDATLSYEHLRDTIRHEAGWGQHVALLFEHGICRHRRGRSASPDSEARTKFFDSFVQLAKRAGLPDVDSKQRKGKAGFLWYPRKGTLTQIREWPRSNASRGVWLVAKFVHGSADIEITGGASVLVPARLAYALRGGDVRVEHDDKSVRLSVDAPILHPDIPLDEQLSDANRFVERLAFVRQWWEATGRFVVGASVASVPDD